MDQTTQIFLRPSFSGRHGETNFLQQQSTCLNNDEETFSGQRPLNDEYENAPNENDIPLRGILLQQLEGCSETSKAPHQRNICAIWCHELLALLFAMALLIAICIILTKYNGVTQPDWGSSGITLNTLIATLAMLFRSNLAFISLEVIAQIKWDWVSGRFRPLRDFQLFDAASRGVLGSMRLLPLAFNHDPRAFIAIIATAVSLGIGPFMQQIVRTYPCPQKNDFDQKATITTANSVDFTQLGTIVTIDQPDLGPEIRTAMQDALVNPSHNYDFDSLFTCRSGNCTFPKFSNNPDEAEDEKITHASIGMCNQCVDVHSLVQGPMLSNKSVDKINVPAFTLPVYHEDGPLDVGPMKIELGVRYGVSFPYMQMRAVSNLTWTQNLTSSGFINRARWSVYNFTILAASQNRCTRLSDGNITCPHSCAEDDNACPFDAWAFSGPSDYIAGACTVYPCLKHYSASVEGGRFAERIVRDVPLRPQLMRPLWTGSPSQVNPTEGLTSVKAIQEPCLVNGTLYTSHNMSSSKNLDKIATDTVQVHVDDWMNESISSPADYINSIAPLECVATMDPDILLAFRTNPFGNVTCYYYRSSIDKAIGSFRCRGDSNDVIDQSSLVALMRGTNTSMSTLQESIDSLTTRVTTEIRKKGRGPHTSQRVFIKGDEWEIKVCVRVAWQWLALPAIIFVLCAVALLWTIVRGAVSQNKAIWKSSSLPIMLRDYPGIQDAGLRTINRIADRFELKVERQKDI